MHQFRIASLSERELFYKREFSTSSVNKWIKNSGGYPQFYVIDAGTETGIIKDKSRLKKLIIFTPGISLGDLREKLIRHIPEDVYMDRNIYKNPQDTYKKMVFHRAFGTESCLRQMLAFDIDSGNIKCTKCRGKNFLYFCQDCFRRTTQMAEQAYYFLKKSFAKIECVYSGRGFHLYVLDKRAYFLTVSQRQRLNKKMLKYAIDPWVSRGYIRLMRLPYTLNSIVSRIAIPLQINEVKGFNPATYMEAIPNFVLRNPAYSDSSSFS